MRPKAASGDASRRSGPLGARLLPRREARRGGLILLFRPGASGDPRAEALADQFAEAGWDALLLPMRDMDAASPDLQGWVCSLEAPVFLLGLCGAAAAAASVSQSLAGLAGTVCLPDAGEKLAGPKGDLAAPLLLHQPQGAPEIDLEAPEREGLVQFSYPPGEIGDWTGGSDTARLALLRTRQFFHRLAGPREAGA